MSTIEKYIKLPQPLNYFLYGDHVRMVHLLLSKTNLDIKMKGVETEKFESNIRSSQGVSINGVLFNIYSEDSFRRMRNKINNIPYTEHSYYQIARTNLPEEMIYTDDIDNKRRKQIVLNATVTVFLTRNLKVNQNKTEHTVFEKRNRNTAVWINVKVRILIGNAEDII